MLVTGASAATASVARARWLQNTGRRPCGARLRERLTLAGELRYVSAAEVEILRAELSDSADLLLAERCLDSTDQPIDLLVNNAGAIHLSGFPDRELRHLIAWTMMPDEIARMVAAWRS